MTTEDKKNSNSLNYKKAGVDKLEAQQKQASNANAW